MKEENISEERILDWEYITRLGMGTLMIGGERYLQLLLFTYIEMK